ncbi:MAG: hypothetical protein HC904_10555 [Blastochloris sp.]|nr:hypothetical protein [Blastochloris sp.]
MKHLKHLLLLLLALASLDASVWAKVPTSVEKNTTQKECDEVDPGDEDSFE